MLVKSGMLSVLVNIGIDFLLISITEIAIPLLFAGLDFLICVLDLFNINSWYDQLTCAEQHCFNGPNAAADLVIFTSVPVLLNRAAAILEATINSRTGKLFVTGDQGVTSEGKTRDPDTRETIPNVEPQGSTSPKPDVSFVNDVEDFFSNPEADQCAACFVCKFPEMRLIWYLVTSIASIASSSNFYTFSGNVTDACMSNGVRFEIRTRRHLPPPRFEPRAECMCVCVCLVRRATTRRSAARAARAPRSSPFPRGRRCTRPATTPSTRASSTPSRPRCATAARRRRMPWPSRRPTTGSCATGSRPSRSRARGLSTACARSCARATRASRPTRAPTSTTTPRGRSRLSPRAFCTSRASGSSTRSPATSAGSRTTSPTRLSRARATRSSAGNRNSSASAAAAAPTAPTCATTSTPPSASPSSAPPRSATSLTPPRPTARSRPSTFKCPSSLAATTPSGPTRRASARARA